MNVMESGIVRTLLVLTALLSSACASTPTQQAHVRAADPCEDRAAIVHCISAKELMRFGARDPAQALRQVYPWIY
jgi:hypothetical protein